MNQHEYSGRDNLQIMAHAKNYNRYLLDQVLQHAQIQQRIVDFGAGNGTFCAPLAQAGYQLMCVETDPTLSLALQAQGLTVVSDLASVADGSVDYIYSLNVLEHIADDGAIARLWWQKLRPGGQLLVFVPAFQSLFTSMDRHVGHHRRYTRASLGAVLEQAQFHITHSQYADSLGILATLVYKWIDPGTGQVNIQMLKLYDRWVFPISRLLDHITAPWGGKNVLVRALKPS